MTLAQRHTLLALLLAVSLLAPAASAQQDVITVGTVGANAGTTVDVPVYIRDVSGTPLGMDQPTGSKIQSFSIKVDYAPAAAVSSVTFSRAGITSSLTPTFETSPQSAGSVSLLDTFQESTNLIPFTLNAGAPGNQVAHLVFNLSPSSTPGSTITLTLNTASTQLTDAGGSAATKESSPGTLTLVNGAINIAPLTLTLTPSPVSAPLHSSSTTLTATISGPVGSSTTVNLLSSSPSIATVPASVNILPGATTALIAVNALAIGTTTITGTLPPASGGATSQATVNVVPPSLSLNPLNQTVPLGGPATMTLGINAAQPSDTVVTLSTADPAIATVQASVTLTAGTTSTTFPVNGIALGATTLQATLPASLGSGSRSANLTVSAVCLTPAAPTVSAPSEAGSGIAYDVSWPAVTSASEYAVDEALDANFTSPSTTTVTATHATFTHSATTDTRYYYRVRARNHSGACDNTSPSSTAVSVLVKAGVPPIVRILPVVGSLPGANGSFFKTSVQLYNSKGVTATGKIVFHTTGTSGNSGDPFLTYALAPGKTINYDDLLPAMSKSGLGSADIIGDANSPLPVSSVRVFNDGGPNGTSGLSEEAVNPADALVTGDSGAIIAPADFAKFRLNIGIRSLDQGVSFTVTVRDKDGVVVKTADKSFGPTFFTQPGSAAFLDGFALTGGETLTFTITSGSAIIYGSTTDNTTNDPSLQLVHKN